MLFIGTLFLSMLLFYDVISLDRIPWDAFSSLDLLSGRVILGNMISVAAVDMFSAF